MQKLHNITKHALVATLLIGALGCGKRSSSGVQPEIMRSIEYRDEGYDPVYDIEYDDSDMPSYDDECIMMRREEWVKRINKKPAVSVQKDTL